MGVAFFPTGKRRVDRPAFEKFEAEAEAVAVGARHGEE